MSNAILSWIDKKTSWIPIFGKTRLGFRLAVLFTLIVAIIWIPILWSILPNVEDKLTEQSWCIREISLNGERVATYQERMKKYPDEYCGVQLDFEQNGTVWLPGINEHRVKAHWKLEKRRLIISAPESKKTSRQNLSEIESHFAGTYKVKIKDEELVLKSERLNIKARAFEQLWERETKD